jgi:3-deoxy-D-manno-octulosonic-acid transferase
MTFLYDLAYWLYLVMCLPLFLVRKKAHPGLAMRLGRIPRELSFRRPLWIHAVSVGEMMTMKSLISQIRGFLPQQQLVLSTVTPTGNAIARSIAAGDDAVIYLPLDISGIVRAVLERVQPGAFVIAETEFWPNMLTALSKRSVPVMIVNGRISDRSFPRYAFVRNIFCPVLNRVTLFCMQTETDAERLCSLGVPRDKIRVTGNMKFDSVSQPVSGILTRQQLGMTESAFLLVAGSTHAGEEEPLLDVFKEMVKLYPSLKMVLAPRHPERSADVEKLVAARCLSACRMSRLTRDSAAAAEIFILDTVGQLTAVYSLADIVFIGGSLVKTGGHNILEPAALAKPVVCGPYMFNFRDIIDLFVRHEAVWQIKRPQELSGAFRSLLETPGRRQSLGKKGQELVQRNKGATARTATYLKEILLALKK